MDRDEIYNSIFLPIFERAKRMREQRKIEALEKKPNLLVISKFLERQERERKRRLEEVRQRGSALMRAAPAKEPLAQLREPSDQQGSLIDGASGLDQDPFVLRGSNSLPQRGAMAGPSPLEKLVGQHSPIRHLHNTYQRGDDINKDFLDYLHANIVCNERKPFVLGEDVNFYLGLRAIASGMSTLFEGRSRSGKTLLLNRIKELLPGYVEIGGASNNALLDRSDEINEKGYVIFSEYQAVVEGNSRIKEATKCISEDADYHFSSLSKTKTLEGKVVILGTSADENKKTQNRDVEVSGRFIILKTDSSQEKIRTICDYQDALSDGTAADVTFSESRYARICEHYQDVLQSRYRRFENPFAKSYAPALPETQKSLHYRTLYQGLINGSASFESANRVHTEDRMIINLSDIYLIHEYYHQVYCDTLKRLSAQSYAALQKGFEIPDLNSAYEHELEIIDTATSWIPDWEGIWRHGLDHMKKQNPLLVDEWISLQEKGGYITIDDPIRRESIKICEAR